MKCGKCGTENDNKSKVCRRCGAELKSKSRGKSDKFSKIIIGIIAVLSVILIVCLVLGICSYVKNKNKRAHYTGGGGGYGYSDVSGGSSVAVLDPQEVLTKLAEINGGSAPQIYCNDDNVPIFIDGKYSQTIVTDYNSAIRSLNDIAGIMQMTQPFEEFTGKETYTVDNKFVFYKLSQVVNEVQVYGRELIVETDIDGNILSLSGEYVPGITLEGEQTVTREAAEEKAKAIYTQYTKVLDTNRYVYELTLENPVLCWAVDMGFDELAQCRVFVSVFDGSVVWTESLLNADAVQSSGIDMRGNQRTFNSEKSDGNYIMYDSERRITVYNWNEGNGCEVVSSSNQNSWESSEAVSAYSNLCEIVDFYKNNIYTRAFDANKLRNITVNVNFRPSDSQKAYDNAFSSTTSDELTGLYFGTAEDYAGAFDVAAHEFTHSVTSVTCGLKYMNQSGAISEGYADIMGTCMESLVHSEYMTGSNEWLICEDVNCTRNLQYPNKSKQPEKVGGKYMAAYCYENDDHENCDNGGVHKNSGIINKAGYLMYSKGINDKYQLMSLLSRSMNYMVSSSDFVGCRLAVLRAAKDMELGTEKINAVAEAFDEVGIEAKSYVVTSVLQRSGKVAGRVADSTTNEPIRNAVVTVKKTASTPGMSEFKAYTDENGNFTVDVSQALSGTQQSANCVLVIGATGYDTCTIGGITVVQGETTYLENTILLKNNASSSVAQIGGVVTNAVSGEAVEGVVIKFRNQYGTSEGEYVYVAGSVVVLNTDSEGKYYSSKLSRGYYTAEISKDGYVTQYVNVYASGDENALNQNIVLSPIVSGDEFRITLEWDEDPRDEDAHIEGSLPSGNTFHVYYADKNKEINGVTVANLDHDDTQGNGFETVTLKVQDGGSYKFYVYHYAGDGSLSTSNAKVKVYCGDAMVRKYNVPVNAGNGKYWNVFKIENGEVVDVNTISDGKNF